MTPAFSPTRHVTDFSAPCGIPAHACLCVALFICHPPFPILPSQRRPPCRDAKSCVSRPLHHPSTHTKSSSTHRCFPLVRRKILRLYFCVDTLSPCFPAAVLICVRRDDVAGRMFMPASTAITAIPVSPFSICHNVFEVMRERCFVLF